jgi:hypothetical protein
VHRAAQWYRGILDQVVQALFQEMKLPGIGPSGEAAGLGKQAEQLQLGRRLGVGV